MDGTSVFLGFLELSRKIVQGPYPVNAIDETCSTKALAGHVKPSHKCLTDFLIAPPACQHEFSHPSVAVKFGTTRLSARRRAFVSGLPVGIGFTVGPKTRNTGVFL
jgi:hypothetical protein